MKVIGFALALIIFLLVQIHNIWRDNFVPLKLLNLVNLIDLVNRALFIRTQANASTPI